MASGGQNVVRSKIIIDHEIIEQIREFNYLGCRMNFYEEADIGNKLCKFQQALGIMNRSLKPNVARREPRVKGYKVLVCRN